MSRLTEKEIKKAERNVKKTLSLMNNEDLVRVYKTIEGKKKPTLNSQEISMRLALYAYLLPHLDFNQLTLKEIQKRAEKEPSILIELL